MPVIDVLEDLAVARAGMVVQAIWTGTMTVDTIQATTGLLVVPGASDDTVKLPTTAGDIAKALGITIYNPMHMPDASGNEVAAKQQVNFLRMGLIWVAVEGAVTRGNAPFVRHAAGAGGSQLGAFRADADTATATAMTHARFETSTSSAGLALVSLSLPV